MDESPLFLRIRTITFSLANFVSFLWIILYCVVIFLQWDAMDRSERSLISVMLIVNIITLITLLILLLLEFRVWLDLARVCVLLLAQIGTAGAFAQWRPQFRCEQKLGDQQGVCDMISLYVLITSWIIPMLLLTYIVGLGMRAYRRRSATVSLSALTFGSEKTPTRPKELNSARPSLLPIMMAFQTPVSLTFPPETHHSKPMQSVNIRRSVMSGSSRYSTPPATPSTSVNPGRLSKRSPLIDSV